jgi:hypothetical protein
MKLALTTRFGHDEELIFAQQLGADGVVVRTDLGDPADTDLVPVAHRVRVAGLDLAAVELTGLPSESSAWSNGLTGALLAAEAADIDRLLCAPPVARSARLAEEIAAVVAASSEAGVVLCLESSGLRPEDVAWLPAGNVRGELVIDAQHDIGATVEQVRGGGVEAVRIEGGGQPLGEGGPDVPRLLAALAGAGFDGLVRAGAAPRLTDDDDDWNPKGAANDLGYLRAVLQSLASRP